MKNDTQKFHVGDEVEVTNTKLKSYGTKGTVKELGYSPFYPDYDGTVRVHNFKTTGHDCLVALQSGSTIRIKDDNIKVTKKNTTTATEVVDLEEFYDVVHRNGHIEQVYVFDCEFNKNVEGPYFLAINLNAVSTMQYSLYTIPDVTMEKVTNKGTLERLQKTKNTIEKGNTTYTVVIEGRKMSSFTDRANMENRQPYFDERSFYDRRSMDSMFGATRKDNFKELRSNYDTSFTVRGDRLDGLIRELILEQGVSQESIKVYKLQSPQMVDVKVDISIK